MQIGVQRRQRFLFLLFLVSGYCSTGQTGGTRLRQLLNAGIEGFDIMICLVTRGQRFARLLLLTWDGVDRGRIEYRNCKKIDQQIDRLIKYK